ncbi:hypothetical protein SAMN02745229_03430 [Butyrivibrio fibrisolvens DSM 3071]|uniref:Uncharacterized protein n=1 Tax=Butyrivibrio fibrisolvens DSM 3071 TaxID=1121131 RepID=A0A1M6D018_BUTFI|nr:hypothetical protein SAMN02745229_03430 [Butyrivibrio fibrisolvens DSM 3071]
MSLRSKSHVNRPIENTFGVGPIYLPIHFLTKSAANADFYFKVAKTYTNGSCYYGKRKYAADLFC